MTSHTRSLVVVVVVLAALAACAPPPQVKPPDARVPYDPARVSVRSGDSTLDLRNGGAEVVPISTGLAWSALQLVYRDLGLEVNQLDPVGHQIAGQRYRSRRPFGGRGLADLVDCGETAGVPNAQRFDVTLNVLTALRSAGTDSTQVATWVLASAKPSTTASEEMRCTANDVIPRIIADRVRKAAQPSR